MVDEFLALAYYREKKLPVIVGRLFNTVGPRQTGRYGMVIPRFVHQALHGEPLTVYGDGQQARCFCDVADVVQAIIRLAGCAEAIGQVFNVGSTEEVTILDLARKVLTLVDNTVGGSKAKKRRDLDSHIIFVPYEEAYETGFEDMRRRVPDINKIKAVIGWKPKISLDVILRNIFRSLQTDKS
jgi:UDP-glucose 4-epimerase